MKTIPEIRKELLQLASEKKLTGDNSTARKLKAIVKNLYRRPSVRRAAKESTKFTPELAGRIRTYAIANPNASYITMCKRFNVSTGRVSEAIAGKRAA